MRVQRGFNHEHLRGERVHKRSHHVSLLCSTPTPSLPHIPSFLFPQRFQSVLCFPPASNSTLSSNPLSSLPFNSALPFSCYFLHSLTLPSSYFPLPHIFLPSSRLLSSLNIFQVCLHLSTLPSLHHPSPKPLQPFPLLFITVPHPFLHSTAASSQNLRNRKSGVTPGSGSPRDT